jgi:hypothetical protein
MEGLPFGFWVLTVNQVSSLDLPEDVLVIPGTGTPLLLFIGEQLRHRLHGEPLHIQVLRICWHVPYERSNLSLMSEIVLYCLG